MKNKMRIITVNVPEKFITILDNLSAIGLFASRSEVIRASIFKFLDEHAPLLELVKEVEKMKRVVPRARTEYDMRTEEGRQQVRDVLEKFLDEAD